MKITVLFKVTTLTSKIMTSIIKNWPKELHYIIQTELDIHIDDISDFENISITKEKKILKEIISTNPDMVILTNDESSICIPDIEFTIKHLDKEHVGIVSPQAQPDALNEIYSPEKTTTPDFFLSSVVIPKKYIKMMEKEIESDSNRWIGHDIAIFCIANKIKYELIPYHRFFMPTPNIIKGSHIIKNRILAKRTITLAGVVFSDNQSMTTWVKKNHEIHDLIKSLPTKTTVPSIDIEAKKIIDRHLTELTEYLLNNAHAKTYNNKNEEEIQLKNKKVAIFKIDSIGDFVISTSMLDSIFKSQPKEICIITTNAIASVYEHDRRISRIISFEENRKLAITTANTYLEMTEDLNRLYNELKNFDIAIFPRYYPDFSFGHHLALLLGIHLRVGIINTHIHEGEYINQMYQGMLTHFSQPLHEQHEVNKINSLAKILNTPSPTPYLNIPIASHNAHRKLNALSGDFIVIGMGAMSLDRRYPIEKIVAFTQLLETNCNTKSLKVVLIGGNDVPDVKKYIEHSNIIINLIGKCSLAESATLISKAVAYIGNDSGTMHIAAALSIPCIEISMHSKLGEPWHVNSPMRFGPWGVKSLVLQPERPLEDQCVNGCVANSPHCILQITPESIMQALLKITDKAKQ